MIANKIYTKENGYKYKVTFSRKGIMGGLTVHNQTIHFCTLESAKDWVRVVGGKIGFFNFKFQNN